MLKDYLKNPIPHEDPKLTQIDMLKSKSIEIFYNLIMVQSNLSMRQFICSEAQKSKRFEFLRNLAVHMLYSSQTGIKIGICEFLKDLIGQDGPDGRLIAYQDVFLSEVISVFLKFLNSQNNINSQSSDEGHKIR